MCFHKFLIFTSFSVGDFVEGKDLPNTRVYGKIVGILGSKRHVKHQVKFKNGNVLELAKDKILPRTFDLECQYFDYDDPDEDGSESVGSVGSAASKTASKSGKSAILTPHDSKKKRY